MNVYELKADSNHYQSLDFVNKGDWDNFLLGRWDGRHLQASWSALEVRVLGEDEAGEPLPAGDFPSLGGIIPVFSRRARSALSDLLRANGEFLPLKCDECAGGSYDAYNVTRVVDALDETGSELKRFKSSGRVQRVLRHEFRPEFIADLHIFRIPQENRVYVTDLFVERVRAAGLTGFEFLPLWSVSGRARETLIGEVA